MVGASMNPVNDERTAGVPNGASVEARVATMMRTPGSTAPEDSLPCASCLRIVAGQQHN
jgi:hypothetical protein